MQITAPIPIHKWYQMYYSNGRVIVYIWSVRNTSIYQKYTIQNDQHDNYHFSFK